jgi:hypothetical protein
LKAGEAIMSSPIHHAEDIDPALIYAPPKVREGASSPRRFSGDVAMVQLQRQLALHPEAVPEPPETERVTRAASDAARALWPMVLRFVAVVAVAAVVAWGIIMIPSPKKSGAIEPAQEVAQLAADPPPAEPATNRVKLVHVEFADATPVLNPEKFVATNEPASSEPPGAAGPSVPAPPSVSPSPDASTLPPDNREIATLVKRGKDFLVNGDLASARLLLKHAAEAGSAEGALALGATFDPEVIKRLGAIGTAADIAQAREWYQKAAALGSPTAAQQLAKLTAAAQ